MKHAHNELKQLTLSHEGVNLPDSDDVCQHVAEPLRVNKVEVGQERILVVEEGSVVVEKPHRLL